MRSRLDITGYSKWRDKNYKVQAYNPRFASPEKIIYTAVAKLTPSLLYSKWEEKRIPLGYPTGCRLCSHPHPNIRKFSQFPQVLNIAVYHIMFHDLVHLECSLFFGNDTL
jgi:hypothetical protein